MKIKTILCGLSLATSANAAVIADYSFDEYTVTGTSANNENGTYTDLDLPKDVNLISTSITTVGYTEGSGGTYAGELNLTGWDTNTFKITLDVGTSTLDLDSIVLNVVRNGAGAPTDMKISIGSTSLATFNGMSIRNGGDGALPGSGFENTFALTGVTAAQGLTGVVVLDFARDSGALNGNLRINDLVINGTITPVPEPSSTALLGLGGLALILRRRK